MAHELIMQKVRGILIIIAGLILLFYNFGYFQQFGTTLLVLFSIFLIVIGFFDAGYYEKIMKNITTKKLAKNKGA